MKILVNVNHKGGVGKTTNTIHIGAELANRNYKVLLIDADNQCDLTAGTGTQTASYTIDNFLKLDNNFSVSVIYENLHLLSGSSNFVSGDYKRMALSNAITHFNLDNFYDFILIDVPPTGINPRVVSPAELAVCSCDYVFVPLQADTYSLKNIGNFLSQIIAIREYNPKLAFLGMYFTNVLTTTSIFTQYYETLKNQAPDDVFTTFIRRDAEVIKAAACGKTIFEYNSTCRASEDFKALTDEILVRIKNIENGKER